MTNNENLNNIYSHYNELMTNAIPSMQSSVEVCGNRYFHRGIMEALMTVFCIMGSVDRHAENNTGVESGYVQHTSGRTDSTRRRESDGHGCVC
jgi:hypothetical protein